MLRVRIISNIAVSKDFFSVKKQQQYTQAYQQEIHSNPKMNFIDWIRKHKILTPEQIEILRKNYLSSWLLCKRCDQKFQVKDTDYQKPLNCPNCGSEALEILKKSEGKLVKEKPNKKGTEVLDIFQTETLLINDHKEDSEEFFPNDIINKNLQIIEKIGQGGMGAVYKAMHLNLNVPRAIKVLTQKLTKDKEQEMRFIREARSAAVLDHQNIVKVHNVDSDRDRLFIEMEWVEGDSIQDKIKSKGCLTIEESIDYIIQAAKGLSAAHRKGIIHRDIKPDNLMITVENVVKIADFGLAKPSDASMDMQISQTGTILGTPYYMSPEQAQNQDVKFLTDIYSLGVTLYHMLTGEVPYVGESAIQVLFQHIKTPFPSIRKKIHDIPLEIDHLILRMTAKNPQMRPQSMLEIIEELESIREKYNFVPIRFTDFRAYSGRKKKSKTVMHREKKKKSPMIIFLLFALIFLLGGIGYIWWEFGNLSDIYSKYLKTYFNDDSLLPKDSEKEKLKEKSEDEKKINPENETKKNNQPEQTEPTEEQLKIKRNIISGRKFRSLKDEFTGKNFSEYIRKLEDFRAQYADTTIVTEVDDEIRNVKENRETAANSWWISKRDQYLRSVNEKIFVKAYAILESFPKDFVETEQAKIIDDRKDDIRDDAILERDAEIIYDEFLALTKLEKLTKIQIDRIGEITEKISKKYKDTRFYKHLTEITDFEILAKKKFDTEEKRKQFEENRAKYNDLMKTINDLLENRKYQAAIDLMFQQREIFDEKSEWRVKIDEIIETKQNEVTELFANTVKTAKKQVNDGKHLGAEGAEGTLKSISSWGLTEMCKEAEKLLQTVYREYIESKLEKHLLEKSYKPGIIVCDNILADMRFEQHFKYVKYRKNEFELFSNGFVKIPAVEVPVFDIGQTSTEKKWKQSEFYISQHEITNMQFQKFIDADGYKTKKYWSDQGWKLLETGKFKYAGGNNQPKTWGSTKCDADELNQPVTGISYYEAEAVANYYGWMLPTAEQWLISAGWDNDKKNWRQYPWGDKFSENKEKPANLSTENNRAKISDVGKFKNDKSYFNLYDCAGNVREWIKTAEKAEKAMVLGAHFLQDDGENNAKIGKINSIKKNLRESYTGFRCVVILQNPDAK